jgi:hypothetical protein
MPRIEYEPPLGPARPDRIAPGDKARREQNRRRKESDRQGPSTGKREHEDADNKDRDADTQSPGRRVDLEV